MVGPPEERCCVEPLVCTETAYTRYTCEYPMDNFYYKIHDAYSVSQAFLALFIACTTIAFVFSTIALTPNGVMDITVALRVTFAFAFIGTILGIITFGVLQGYASDNGMYSMPTECGYLVGAFILESVGAGCAYFAWRPYFTEGNSTETDEMKKLEREHEVERLRFETLQFKVDRLRLQDEARSVLEADEHGLAENGVTDEEERQHGTPVVTALDLQQT